MSIATKKVLLKFAEFVSDRLMLVPHGIPLLDEVLSKFTVGIELNIIFTQSKGAENSKSAPESYLLVADGRKATFALGSSPFAYTLEGPESKFLEVLNSKQTLLETLLKGDIACDSLREAMTPLLLMDIMLVRFNGGRKSSNLLENLLDLVKLIPSQLRSLAISLFLERRVDAMLKSPLSGTVGGLL